MGFKEEYLSAYLIPYSFHKKFYGIEGTDQEWENLIEEAKRLYIQCRDNPFEQGLIRLIIDEFERTNKKKNESGESEK